MSSETQPVIPYGRADCAAKLKPLRSPQKGC